MADDERQLEKGDPPAELPQQGRGVQDTTCADGNGCFWSQTSYGGTKYSLGAGSAGTWFALGATNRSAKNRFADRKIQFGHYLGGGSYTILDCLDAGGNNANLLAAIDSVRIGAQGSTC